MHCTSKTVTQALDYAEKHKSKTIKEGTIQVPQLQNEEDNTLGASLRRKDCILKPINAYAVTANSRNTSYANN